MSWTRKHKFHPYISLPIKVITSQVNVHRNWWPCINKQIYIYIYIYIHIQGGPKVGIQYIVYKLLYTYFGPPCVCVCECVCVCVYIYIYIYIYITLFSLRLWIQHVCVRKWIKVCENIFLFAYIKRVKENSDMQKCTWILLNSLFHGKNFPLFLSRRKWCNSLRILKMNFKYIIK